MNRNRRLKIIVVGMGYVGLSVSLLLAGQHDVTGIETDENKIRLLNAGISPLNDKYISNYLNEMRQGKRSLSFRVRKNDPAVFTDADCIILAVPTNYDSDLGGFDTSVLDHVFEEITDAVRDTGKEPLIVIRSTVPIGHCGRLREDSGYRRILFSPEFLRESRALYDNLYPSRIVIGAPADIQDDAEAFAAILRNAAEKKDMETVVTGLAEAESVKLFANTYLAMRVAFFNELDTFAETGGLNTSDIIRGMCLDPRIGDYYNNPSFGYGGYCLPKDSRQLLSQYKKIPEEMVRAIVRSNRTRKEYIADRIFRLAGDSAPIGIWRLTMKTGSDNFRESAILDIIDLLRKKGAKLIIYEPALHAPEFEGFPVTADPAELKEKCTLIVANRLEKELFDIRDRVYTRDLYFRD